MWGWVFLLALLLVLTVFDYLTLDSPVLKYDIVVVFSSGVKAFKSPTRRCKMSLLLAKLLIFVFKWLGIL